MILDALDCFFIIMVLINFGFIIHLETQVRMLRSMMEEHTRFDDRLCEISKELQKSPIQN